MLGGIKVSGRPLVPSVSLELVRAPAALANPKP